MRGKTKEKTREKTQKNKGKKKEKREKKLKLKGKGSPRKFPRLQLWSKEVWKQEEMEAIPSTNPNSDFQNQEGIHFLTLKVEFIRHAGSFFCF